METASGDVTTWRYDDASGVLLSKTDAGSHSVRYTYDATGRVSTRTWARGATTKYDYDGAGRLTHTAYYQDATMEANDGTPGAVSTYDRAGRRLTTADAAGIHTFTYAGSGGGQPTTWSVTGSGAWSGLSVVYGYSGSQRTSRDSRLATLMLPSVGYTYDNASGRMSTVDSDDITVSYRYNDSTGWNEGITYNGGMRSIRIPDALGRLDSINWSISGATVSGHDYTLNAMNRRTAAQRQDGSGWGYGYNGRGEVTSAAKGTEAGKQFAFEYDGIGNRTTSKVSSLTNSALPPTTTYTPNSLNQYASIAHPQPGSLVLRGSINTTPGVTLKINDNLPTQLTGGLWYYEESVFNPDGPLQRVVEIAASRSTGGRTGGPVTIKKKGVLFIPPPTETPTYDLDGNQLSDARWNYVWDGENRLRAIQEKPGFAMLPADATVTLKRLEFSYDAKGRRITKRTLASTSGAGFVLQQSLVYLYDGWNMIAEIDTTTNAQLLRSYEWGPDLSGTLEGAGGVGGLLIERFPPPSSYNSQLPSSGAHAPCYDGNGNITELVNLTNGDVSARYEYGALGETISMDGGSVAQMNPFRFSTKCLDVETGLYNYGYRYYDAENGRWLSRDPIGERGGLNVYGMTDNDPINSIDVLGRATPAKGNKSTLPEKDKRTREEIVSKIEKQIPNMDNPFAVVTSEGPQAEKWALHWLALKAWVATNKVAGGPEWAGVLCKKCCDNKDKGLINQYFFQAHQAGGMHDMVFDRRNACPIGYDAVGWFHSHPGMPTDAASDPGDWDRYNNPPGFNQNRNTMAGGNPKIDPARFPGPEDPGTLGTSFPTADPQVQTLDSTRDKNKFMPALPGPPSPQFISERCPQ